MCKNFRENMKMSEIRGKKGVDNMQKYPKNMWKISKKCPKNMCKMFGKTWKS